MVVTVIAIRVESLSSRYFCQGPLLSKDVLSLVRCFQHQVANFRGTQSEGKLLNGLSQLSEDTDTQKLKVNDD